MTDTASASFLVYEDTPPPGPTPCDTNPIVHISLSSTNIELGEDVVVTVTATDPTGGLIELTSAIVTPPSGSVNKQEFSSLNGHLQFTVTGNEENAWHILVTCQNSCDTQEMTDTASASFLVYEDTPPPPTCQNPTLRAKIDGSYISNNSTLQREIGDSISLRIEAEDSDDCGPCGTSVDGISIIRVHVWKGNEANTVFSWDTSQGTMSLSNPFKTFSFNDEGTYGIDTTVQDDDCDRHREAELHFLIEVEDPEIPPEQPVYELDVSNLTRPSGPNYTCHQIAAIIRMVSGEAEGPMSIRWGDGNESSGLTGIHQYSEADGHVIQALNGAGEVVAYASINIQFRECVAPEIEVISAPPSDAFVGDSYLVSIKGSDEDQEWTSCLCQDSCVAGHGIYRAQINVFDPSGNVVKNLELECSEVAFPMTLTGTFDEVGDYRVVIWIEDDDNLCGCLCNCAHNDNEELIIHVTQRP